LKPVLFLCLQGALLLLSRTVAPAQITGDLRVNVSDVSGAAISGASVSVRSAETGAQRTFATDTNGEARATQLSTGRYQVEASQAGFAKAVAFVQVSSGTVAALPIVLQVASAQDQVTVLGELTPVNSVNAQIQTTIQNADIQNLPITSAGVLALATTAPGVTPVTANNPFLGLGSYNSNGGRGRGNNITIDSATATDVSVTGSAGLATIPLDAIKEVNLITNQFSAEYGRNANSQFQIITSGGSNQFHGETYLYSKNAALNSRDYFDRTGRATPIRDNRWGAFAGGAIIKDKLFYFGSYDQQTIRGSGGTRIARTLTPTQAATAAPEAKQLLGQYQVPATPSGTVSVSAPNSTDQLSYSGKLEANLTPRDTLFVRMGENSAAQQATSLTFITSNLAGNGASSVVRPWTATISETHIFSPRTINNFLVSFGRSDPRFVPLASMLGPEIVFGDGTSGFGPWSGLPQGRVQNTFQYLDSVTRTVGAHTLKFGFELNRIQANSSFDSNVRGTLTYLTLNDFLNDNPFQYSQRFGNSVRGYRVWNEFMYAQDDYRATRNLTLNLGFRLEIAHGPTEVNNLLSNMDPTLTTTPLGGAGTGPMGAFYTGGSFFGRNYNPGPRVGFAWTPRGGKTVIRGGYGMAYDFVYLNPITNGRFLPPLMYSFTLPQSGFTGTNTLPNLLAGTSDFQKTGAATVGTFGTTIKNFGSVSYIDPNLRNPQVQQFSLTIERQFAGSWTGQLSYSGSKGNYLQRTASRNFITPGLFTPPTTLAEQATAQATGVYSSLNSGLSGSVSARSNRTDGRFNAVSALDSSANSNYHSLQVHVSKRFSGWYGFAAAYTWSKSIDDVSDALGVLAFDSAQQQNPFNNRDSRAVSSFDTPHRVVITHEFISNARGVHNKFVSQLLDKWTFGGIFQAQSGFPVNLRAGTVAGLTDGLLLGVATDKNAGVQRPNLTGPLNLQFSPDPGGGAANPNKVIGSGLTQPLVAQFGALGRNAIRINPFIQADMAFGRTFVLRENLRFQIQAQMTNVFNNTNFNVGSTAGPLTLSAPSTFGYYQGTETDSRRILLVGRILW
jgi:hypothetical protein